VRFRDAPVSGVSQIISALLASLAAVRAISPRFNGAHRAVLWEA